MWEMWESFIKCGHNFENVGNVGPLGTLLIEKNICVTCTCDFVSFEVLSVEALPAVC